MKRKIKNPGRRSRTKGHDFERSVAIMLRRIFPQARRQLEYHSRDARGVDLQETGRYLFQCKKLEKYASISAIEEIEHDADFGEVPVLVTAGDGKMPMAVLPFEHLIYLIDKAR